MFYFIGGAPRCGKTILAGRLSKKLGIPWISADTLESIVSSYVSEQDYDAFFPKSKMRRETGGGNDLMYERYSTEQITGAYILQASSTWKALETFVACESLYGHDYIFEGHQIHPEFFEKLRKKFPDTPFKAVFLGRSDNDTVVRSATEHAGSSDWFTQKTIDVAVYPKIADMITSYSDYFEKEATKYTLPYFSMDTDFLEQVATIEKFITA